MASSQSNAPSFFNFLKEGLLLPSRNRRLFTAVSAFILASTALIVLGNDLALQPLADEIKVDIKALNTTEPGSLYRREYCRVWANSLEYAKLVQEIRNDARELLLVGAGYLLLALVVGAAVRIVVLFAAVSTYSGDGEQNAATFGAILGKAKAQIKGPLLTLAFIYVLQIVYVALLVAMVGLVTFLAVKQYFVTLLVASLLVIAASVCLVYFSFICSFSVVVAVAEPGCYGAAALGKAWRLVKGKKSQVALYVVVTCALAAAVSPVGKLATTCAANSVPLWLLLGLVYAVLLALVQLFTICAMAAFYYERRESVDSQLGATGYAKLSTEEANA